MLQFPPLCSRKCIHVESQGDPKTHFTYFSQELKFCSVFYPMSESHHVIYFSGYLVISYKKSNPAPTTLAAPSHLESNPTPCAGDFIKNHSPSLPNYSSMLASFLLLRHISFFRRQGLCTAVSSFRDALSALWASQFFAAHSRRSNLKYSPRYCQNNLVYLFAKCIFHADIFVCVFHLFLFWLIICHHQHKASVRTGTFSILSAVVSSMLELCLAPGKHLINIR